MKLELRDWAIADPARPALVFAGSVVTYKGVDDLANRYAHLYRRHGLARGDHVAVMFGNDANIVAAVWGAYRAGIYITPIASTLSAPEVAYVVENCDARIVIADVRFKRAVSDLTQSVPGMKVRYAVSGLLDGFDSLEEALALQPATPISDESPGSLMLYSSGTTGAPKGIWRPLPAQFPDGNGAPPFARDLIDLFGWSSQTRYLSTQPLYHAAALRFVLATMAAGGVAYVMNKFDAGAALQMLVDHDITASQWVPAMFRRLLDLPADQRDRFVAPLHRVAIHGAAPCSVAMKQQMIDWWGPILLEYYSGTEGVGLTLIDSPQWLAKPGSVGKTVKGVPHILDDDGRELPRGETGTIYFSGIAPFAYYKAADKTAARTSPDGYQTFGDIGRIDEDGYLYLSDRLDDMIISGGVNLYPQEIEQAIEEMAEVSECAVVGREDVDFGERPVGFVVRRKDSPGSDGEFLERLSMFANQRLGRTKQLREVFVVGQLPRSATGKLLRRALR